jgi:GDP/UDP-N,N'-diacetylbacillosamine 2-epimerase (hydrolysing)
MIRKVCIVTGSRAEYGLLKRIMRGIQESEKLALQVVVTGMHLSPEFGQTYLEIEADGFYIDRKIEMLISSDTPVGVTKAMGLGLIGFADVYAQLQPDIILVLGDRFEILAATTAAMIACIPVAHLHGGELTEGALDDSIRHAITKMSHLHFVATLEYRQRVIQLGEDERRVYLVGGLGVDAIRHLTLLNHGELERALNFNLAAKSLLITFHPLTAERGLSEDQLKELLQALDALSDTSLVFTLPNADAGGRSMIKMIEDFVLTHENARAYTSLGQLTYLSCVAQVDGVVGNSSSGLLEVPSFRKGTINIGDRQQGRLKASSVIDCQPTSGSILRAIERLYSDEFRQILQSTENPYGEGMASEQVVRYLEHSDLVGVIKKRFYDLVFPNQGVRSGTGI